MRSAIEQGLCTPEQAAVHGMTSAAVAGDLPAPEMALRAARDAVEQCPADLGLLLYADTWHQGPEAWFPHYYLQRHLVGDVLAAEVRQGCNGLFCSLELAAAYLRATPSTSAAMLAAADNYGTPHIDRWRSGPFILGDGACAMVLTKDTGFAQVLSVGSAAIPELEEQHRCGEPLFPPGATTGAMVDFTARDEAFVRLSAERSDLRLAWIVAHKKMMQLVSRVLAEAGITAADLTRAAFTNLAPESIEHRWMEVLRMPMDRSTWDYGKTVGHTGAGDPFIALHHLLATGELKAGDHVIMGGVGSGLTVSCAVVKILERPDWD